MGKRYRGWFDTDGFHLAEDNSGCLAGAIGMGVAAFLFISVFSAIISDLALSIILIVVSGKCARRVTGLRVLTIGNLVQAILFTVAIFGVFAVKGFDQIGAFFLAPLIPGAVAVYSRKRIAEYTDEIRATGSAEDIRAAENARKRNIYTMVCSFAMAFAGLAAAATNHPLLSWVVVFVVLGLALAVSALCAARPVRKSDAEQWSSM